MEAVIWNYKLDRYSARDKGRRSPPPKHDTTRLELLAPLIKQTVKLALELEDEIKAPSPILWDSDLINDMLSGGHPVHNARAWCYSHLYRTVVDLASAIMRLVEESYVNASLALLRSVIEAFATCYYISGNLSCSRTICHDYIAYSFLTTVYHMKIRDAELRQGMK